MMQKFDELIYAARPAAKRAPELNLQKFNAKLAAAKRLRLLKRSTFALLATALSITLAVMIQRGLLDLIPLTLRYAKDVPALFGQYARAYGSVIPWPSLIASVVIGAFYWKLVHVQGNKLNANLLRKLTYSDGILAILAIALSVFGLQTSHQHAYAEQQNLRHALNQRGHLEVQVDGVTYEANAKTTASDQLIRNQVFIESVRHYDITKIYPDLRNYDGGGIVAEIRSINPKDGCIFYVERRLEPALGGAVDANAGCLPIYEKRYLNEAMQPVKNPKLKPKQAFYMDWAPYKDDPGKNAVIIVLLAQNADDYIPQSIDQKIVKEGTSPTGSHACGLDGQNTCPDTPTIDVYYSNCSGDCGSAVIGDGTAHSTRPYGRPLELFGKITSISSEQLVIQTPWNEEWTVKWPYNLIEAFNDKGAKNYDIGGAPLRIEVGDSLEILVNADQPLQTKTIDIQRIQAINLALEPIGANPLNETYKNPKTDPIGKYRAD